MQNLFSNSLKFCPDRQPQIGVKASEEGPYWKFEVTDNGVGFPDRDRNKIFQLHTRLHAAFPGSGIGLATCRRVVEIHHGQIWAESEPGEGANFIFTLPKRLA
ncbi:MAG: ATP-binding protein [Pseudobdellovibrionaceae bacterium]